MSSFGWSARLYVHCIVLIVPHTQLLAASDLGIHFAALSAGSPLVSERHDSRTVELRCGGWASCRRARIISVNQTRPPGARLSSQSRSDWFAARPIWYVVHPPLFPTPRPGKVLTSSSAPGRSAAHHSLRTAAFTYTNISDLPPAAASTMMTLPNIVTINQPMRLSRHPFRASISSTHSSLTT